MEEACRYSFEWMCVGGKREKQKRASDFFFLLFIEKDSEWERRAKDGHGMRWTQVVRSLTMEVAGTHPGNPVEVHSFKALSFCLVGPFFSSYFENS